MDRQQQVPAYHQLMWPTLTAVKELGGSGTNREIYEKVIELGKYTEEQQNISHGRMSELEYRLHWARTYLGKVGALENSRRGVWTITDKGRALTEADMAKIPRAVRSLSPRRQRRGRSQETPDEEAGERDWQAELLDVLWKIPADAFERLCQRLLREAGFISVQVTGRSGDEGIDGIGVYRMALVSFPVFFQAKRYRGTVGASTVRDFRGAMMGRGEKGLLITTGSFTADAERESTRQGATPIDLIDGDRLSELLKEYSLGVSTTVRTEEDVVILSDFFQDL